MPFFAVENIPKKTGSENTAKVIMFTEVFIFIQNLKMITKHPFSPFFYTATLKNLQHGLLLTFFVYFAQVSVWLSLFVQLNFYLFFNFAFMYPLQTALRELR